MKFFHAKARDFQKKRKRFRRPEFQQKLERARRFSRQPKQKPKNKSDRILTALGLKSKSGRALAAAAALAAVYFLTASPYFLVRSASISGLNLRSSQIENFFSKVEQSRVFLVPRNHILLIDKENFSAALKAEFADARRVSRFKRVLPNRLEADVEVRERKYVWQAGNEYFFMDQDGVIFQRVDNYDPALFRQTLVSDSTLQPVQIGEKLNVDKALVFLDAATENWERIVFSPGVVSASLPGTASVDIVISTDAGFDVLFDLNRGALGQLQNLQLLLTQEINPETWSGLKYIDLRLPNVGYYCYRDAECARVADEDAEREELSEESQ